MSLEEALNRNTEILERMCSILLRSNSTAPFTDQAEKEAQSMASFKKESTPVEVATSPTPHAGEPPQPTQEISELDYAKDVKPITLKLSREKGRETTLAVLSRFGVKGAQDLDEGQRAAYVSHCEMVLKGGEV